MSYIVLARNKSNGNSVVLDTSDLVTENISEDDFNEAKSLGLELYSLSKSSSIFGLITNGNSYELLVNGYHQPIFSNKFPSRNNRNDLFEFEIKIGDFGRVGNKICILIACNCWCKYDIELPMVMFQVVSIPLNNFKSGAFLALYTSKPLYFSDISVIEMQREECCDDFPDDCAVSSDILYENSLNGSLRLLGVDFGKNVPYSEDVCSRLSYV